MEFRDLLIQQLQAMQANLEKEELNALPRGYQTLEDVVSFVLAESFKDSEGF